MAVTSTSFRLAFPAFANPVKYPVAMVDLWLNASSELVNAERWGNLTDLGVSLMAAHYMALEAQAASAAGGSRLPGGSVGVLSSKSAQGVSASYDTSSATEQGGGHWNMTTYGTRYYRMAKLMGVGPVQVGAPDPSDAAVRAWPGVLPPPW